MVFLIVPDHLPTPYGIEDHFSLRSESAGQYPGRAQRLTASKIISEISGDEAAKCYRCSTPYGIKDQFSHRVDDSTNSNIGCSTPYGIKDHFSWLEISGLIHSLCSTPYGIKDQFRVSTSYEVIIGAQRLTASKIISVIRVDDSANSNIGAQRLTASKIISVGWRYPGLIHRFVLNALRHRRSFQRPQKESNSNHEGAQRLTASKIISGARAMSLRYRCISAQRLTASKIISD